MRTGAGMKPKLTPDQIARARLMHAAGINFKDIGKRLGCHGTTVHRALDAAFARQRQDRINTLRTLQREADRTAPKYSKQTQVVIAERTTFAGDAAARLAEIPKDTRSQTARICGDPIPGDPRRARFA